MNDLCINSNTFFISVGSISRPWSIDMDFGWSAFISQSSQRHRWRGGWFWCKLFYFQNKLKPRPSNFLQFYCRMIFTMVQQKLWSSTKRSINDGIGLQRCAVIVWKIILRSQILSQCRTTVWQYNKKETRWTTYWAKYACL